MSRSVSIPYAIHQHKRIVTALTWTYPSSSSTNCACEIALLGKRTYSEVFSMMRNFTKTRSLSTVDQIWLVEHDHVFTRGKTSKDSDVLHTLPYPMIDTDRGGQITYHGPGQLVCYYLIDLKRLDHINLRMLIQDIENTIITILSRYTIHAKADLSARGVYVDDSKIASIGLRSTSRGTYHGFALNVSTDIRPFTWINPCGKPQKMVNIHMLSSISVDDIIVRCLQAIKDSALLDSRPCRILSDTSYLNEYA